MYLRQSRETQFSNIFKCTCVLMHVLYIVNKSRILQLGVVVRGQTGFKSWDPLSIYECRYQAMFKEKSFWAYVVTRKE